METTIFLAKIWGPVILAVALGVFISHKFYIKIYRDLEKDALAVLVFAMVAMSAGIVHVNFHNVWDTFPQIVVSFLGWGLLIKGIMFAVIPGVVDRSGDFWVRSKLIPIAGVLMLLIGGYLSWFAYLG